MRFLIPKLGKMVLRRGRGFALFAVFLQIVLPGLTIRAAADVLVAQESVICHANDEGQAPQGSPHHHNGLCPICHCCSAAPLFAPAAATGTPMARYSIFVGHAPEFFVLARGPPQARPRSRAPPAVS